MTSTLTIKPKIVETNEVGFTNESGERLGTLTGDTTTVYYNGNPISGASPLSAILAAGNTTGPYNILMDDGIGGKTELKNASVVEGDTIKTDTIQAGIGALSDVVRINANLLIQDGVVAGQGVLEFENCDGNIITQTGHSLTLNTETLKMDGITGGNYSNVLGYDTVSKEVRYQPIVSVDTIAGGTGATLSATTNVSYVSGTNNTLPNPTIDGFTKTIVCKNTNIITPIISEYIGTLLPDIRVVKYWAKRNVILFGGNFSGLTVGFFATLDLNSSPPVLRQLGAAGSPNAQVEDILIDEDPTGGSNDRVYIGGTFTTIAAGSFLRVARFNFTQPPDLTPGGFGINLAGSWLSMGQATGGGPTASNVARMVRYIPPLPAVQTRFIYITGGFTAVQQTAGALTVNRITRYDPDTGANGTFTALGTGTVGLSTNSGFDIIYKNFGNPPQDYIVVAGSFGQAGIAGQTANIAVYNITGNTWQSLTGTSPGQNISAILDYTNTKILVAGGTLTTWNPAPGNTVSGVVEIDVSTTPATRTAFAAITTATSLNFVARLFKSSDGTVFITGQFTRVGRNAYVASPTPEVPGDGQLYAANYIAYLDTSGATALWKPFTNSTETANGIIYAIDNWTSNRLLIGSNIPFLWNGVSNPTQSLAVIDRSKIVNISGSFSYLGKNYSTLQFSENNASITLVSSSGQWLFENSSGLPNNATTVGFGGVNII